MAWVTTKHGMYAAISEVSEAASRTVKVLLREGEYPPEVNALFEAIGRLRAVVEHLPIEAA